MKCPVGWACILGYCAAPGAIADFPLRSDGGGLDAAVADAEENGSVAAADGGPDGPALEAGTPGGGQVDASLAEAGVPGGGGLDGAVPDGGGGQPGVLDAGVDVGGSPTTEDPCQGSCQPLEVCVGGEAPYCHAPLSDCRTPLTVCAYDNGALGCVHLARDPHHCGACGVVCAGTCVYGVCYSSFFDCLSLSLMPCEESDGHRYCADLESDHSNCGACASFCRLDNHCADGVCWPWPDCEQLGLTECDEACVDLTTDPLNCGECGHECAHGCFDGHCIEP